MTSVLSTRPNSRQQRLKFSPTYGRKAERRVEVEYSPPHTGPRAPRVVLPDGRCAYLPSVTCYRQSIKPPPPPPLPLSVSLCLQEYPHFVGASLSLVGALAQARKHCRPCCLLRQDLCKSCAQEHFQKVLGQAEEPAAGGEGEAFANGDATAGGGRRAASGG